MRQLHQLTRGILGAVALGLASATAAHAQATIADCEKIQAADAYNQCLAKFGPTSKVKSLEPERPGDIKSSSEEAAASAGPAKGRARVSAPAANSTVPTEAKAPKTRASRRASRGRGLRRGRVVRAHSGKRVHMTFSVGRRRHR